MERCAGCDDEGQMPIVGIALANDALKDFEISKASDRGFVAFGVCAACHRDPEHRKRPLKMHFFERGVMKHALRNAGSNVIGGR
jgi:hypothetical protein